MNMNKTDIEKFLELIGDSQEIITDDGLADMIRQYDRQTSDELDADELDLISAAKGEEDINRILFKNRKER